MSGLVVERRGQKDKTSVGVVGDSTLMLTPAIDEDYWAYRVRLSEEQAIVAFPKFMTLGVGFAKETDWNTNLPWTVDAEEIFDHISHNKGDESIADSDCVEAIQLIQSAIAEDRDDPA